MSIIKRGAELVYTFRFIRMLTLKWEDWDAFKEGLIDKDGKRIKAVKMDSDKKKASYTPFIRLVANIKRLISKVPGGGSRLGGFASALFLIKEHLGISDARLDKILSDIGFDAGQLIAEDTKWFVLEDKTLSPGIYKVTNHKLINNTFDEMVFANDKVRVPEDCQPCGDVFGIDIYEVIHVNTNQKVYVASNELLK